MAYQFTQNINKTIFRAYDIRGIVGEELTENAVYTIGRALAAMLLDNEEDEIIVARDGRLSGPSLHAALCAGLQDGGCHIYDIGSVPTPVLYFATNHTSIPSGVIVTGSHNPGHYNGLKMVVNGKTLTEQQIQELYQRIQQQNITKGEGSYQTISITEDYLERIHSEITLARPLKIVIDCGNGIAGKIAPALYRGLGCDVIELFTEVDGSFPNHHPDPSVSENLQDLVTVVRAEQADIGLAFDGDADRLGVVTGSGEMIDPDRQLMIFAKAILAKNPKAKIIFDVKCTNNLRQAIEANGGQAIMSRTGHSLVKALMKQEKALLAGEMSGHIFFNDTWYGFDDGLYAGARLLAIFAEQPTCFDDLPKSINTPEIKIPVDEAKKFAVMQEFIEHAQFPGGKLNTLDGVRVEYADGWGLLRASNTSPCLVSRFEADNPEALGRIQRIFTQQLEAIIAREI